MIHKQPYAKKLLSVLLAAATAAIPLCHSLAPLRVVAEEQTTFVWDLSNSESIPEEYRLYAESETTQTEESDSEFTEFSETETTSSETQVSETEDPTEPSDSAEWTETETVSDTAAPTEESDFDSGSSEEETDSNPNRFPEETECTDPTEETDSSATDASTEATDPTAADPEILEAVQAKDPLEAFLYLQDAALGRTVTTAEDDLNQDGYVDGFDCAIAKRYALSAQKSAPVISGDSAVCYAGDTAEVTFRLTRNAGFYSLAFTVVYPSELTLSVADSGIVLGGGSLVDSSAVYAFEEDVDQTHQSVTVVCAPKTQISAEGTLCKLSFTVPETASPDQVYRLQTRPVYMVNGSSEFLSALGSDGSITVEEAVIETTETTTTPAETRPTVSTEVVTGIVADGIDVSRWQGTINWNAVKAAGYTFVMIRAGYGCEYDQVDPMFQTNMQGAKAAGLNCGIYWYSYALTAEEAKKEAEVCLATIQGWQLEYPVAYDVEDPSQLSLTPAQVTAIVEAFAGVMQNAGYFVTLYSFATFFTSHVENHLETKYDIWVAQTNVAAPEYTGSYGLWQYSHSGTVNGIAGDVDLNYAYKDYPAIMMNKGLNGY